MKALLLYDDVEHATPFLRSIDALAECGIVIDPRETHSPESAVELVGSEVDVIIIHQTLMSDDALDRGKPVVILERVDGAQLAASRKWLASVASTGESQPAAAAVLKGYTYTELGRHNTHRGRYHAHLLRTAGMRSAIDESCAIDGLPSPQLSQADLTKIYPGYGFGAYAKMDRPRGQMVDFSSQRDIAMHCACYVDYRGSEIELHRKAAIARSREWAQSHPTEKCEIAAGRRIRHDEYLAKMFCSRVVVSPWGWGEATHRDYEAMLLGAVLVKPSMEHVTCWPDIYRPGETYIPCALDFSDLGQIIDRVCTTWHRRRAARERARQLALEAGDQKRIARRIASVLEMVV